MTVSRALRWLLGLAAGLVVLWSFFDVGYRAYVHWDTARKDTRTELTILHWGDNAEIEIVQTLVEAFEAENTGVRVNRIHASDYDTKLNTMFAAGDPPDLFYLRYEDLPKLSGMGLLEPIDQRVKDDIKRTGEDWVSAFYSVLLKAYRYDGDQLGQGPLYGIPKDFTPMLMYANLGLFRRAGVEVPYDGWTWDEFDDAMKKISALEDPNGRVYGSVIASWPAVLRNMVWAHGGDFFNGNDFNDVTLDEPSAIAAMERIRRMRFDDETAYNASSGDAQGLGEQEFYTGRIGVVGPIGRWKTPRFRSISGFRWDVIPFPHTPGIDQSSAIAVTAWAMSSTSDHPDESFTLMKFLCGPQGQRLTARSGLAVPCTKSVAESDDFLQPGQSPANAQLFVDLIEKSRLGQMPPQTEFTRIMEEEVERSIRLNLISPEQAGKNIETRWLDELRSPLRNKTFPKMPWKAVVGSAAGALFVLVTALFFWLRKEKLGAIDRAQERAGWVFISPWIIGFLVLTFGPMGVSLLLAMSRWTSMQPMSEAEFVGLGNFGHMVEYDGSFLKSVWVTAYYAVLAVPFGQVLALLVAVLMNTKVKGIAFYRTVFFVPSVVSGVALATLWVMMFDNQKGIINRILSAIFYLIEAYGDLCAEGWALITKGIGPAATAGIQLAPPDWFGTDAEVFAIPAYVIMALWGVGAGMVIYLAGLKGIPESLYEAAKIDGAGRMRAFFNVTLPQLSPLIFFNLIMGIIGSFQVFTQVYVMTNGGPGNATLVYVLKLYREAFEYHKMGYASAMAWVLFLVLLVLTLVVVKTSKSWVHYEGLK
jgi:multiple sugar transport system permease protein/multiple sugar transport system substrate-binding protein